MSERHVQNTSITLIGMYEAISNLMYYSMHKELTWSCVRADQKWITSGVKVRFTVQHARHFLFDDDDEYCSVWEFLHCFPEFVRYVAEKVAAFRQKQMAIKK